METLRPAELAEFQPEKMGKVTLASGKGMMVGLNCFEPGQSHALHSHEGMDKLYHVLEGTGVFLIGEQKSTLGAGELVFVPGSVPHGARNESQERLVVLVVLAPPPAAK